MAKQRRDRMYDLDYQGEGLLHSAIQTSKKQENENVFLCLIKVVFKFPPPTYSWIVTYYVNKSYKQGTRLRTCETFDEAYKHFLSEAMLIN